MASKSKMKRAIYAGSFDPVTNGHLWVIDKAAELYDELIVAIGHNPDKNYMFSVDQREEMLRETVSHLKNAKVEIIDNKYLAKFASQKSIPYLIRGIRSTQDYEYEKSMGQINFDLAPEVETIYFIPPAKISQISSSMVKGLIGPEEWEKSITKYVPKSVLKSLKAWYKAKNKG